MGVLVQIVVVAFVAFPCCQGFAPGARRFSWFRPRSSVGGMEGYKNTAPHRVANHTAMDVLESLNFLANIKYRDASVLALFETMEEPIDDSTPEVLALESMTHVEVPETAGESAAEHLVLKTTTNVEEPNQVVETHERARKVAVSEATIDAEIDALFQVSSYLEWNGKRDKKDPKKDKPSTDSESSGNAPDSSAPQGIGGSKGTVYNVNRLKKNLVQEMVKNYKTELWNDLGKPSADFTIVEDKLASLVQSNAVKCTTDSNLLDGEWTFAFGSRQNAAALMDPNRFDIAARRTTHTQAMHSAKVEGPFRSSTRTFYLEDMDEDEDAHVLDRTRYFGGMVGSVLRYNVTRLTRSSLMLDRCYQQWWIFGKRVRQKKFQEQRHQMEDLRILYADNDLCVSTSGDPAKNPFYVYTKSNAWVGRSQRMKRSVRHVFSILRRVRDSVLSILFLRKRVQDALVSKVAADDSTAARILVDVDDDTKKLTVLKLGDLENDVNAWEGEEDPFVHLSADERQEQLKKMRVKDIKRAGRRQKRKPKKDKRAEKRKPFKKPE